MGSLFKPKVKIPEPPEIQEAQSAAPPGTRTGEMSAEEKRRKNRSSGSSASPSASSSNTLLAGGGTGSNTLLGQ